MTTQLTPSRQLVVDTLSTLLTVAADAQIEAARYYVEIIKRDPEMRQILADQIPQVSGQAWIRFEEFGRGLIVQKLLWGGNKAQKALRKLPPSLQEKAFNKPVTLYYPGGRQKSCTVEELSAKEARQVFSKNDIRDRVEQLTWIKAQKKKKRAAEDVIQPGEGWYREGDVIRIDPWKLSEDDLLEMLAELKSS